MPRRHPDDRLMDFACGSTGVIAEALQKGRDRGRSGWQDPSKCSQRKLQKMIFDHLRRPMYCKGWTHVSFRDFFDLVKVRRADPLPL